MGQVFNNRRINPFSSQSTPQASQNTNRLLQNMRTFNSNNSRTLALNQTIQNNKLANQRAQISPLHFVKNQILTAQQKESFVRLVSLLSVLTSEEFSPLLPFIRSQESTDNNQTTSDEHTQFFAHAEPPPTFSVQEIAHMIEPTKICESGQEHEFVESLVEFINTPLTTKNFSEIQHHDIFSRAAHELLMELNLPTGTEPLYEVQSLLRNLIAIPLVASDEQKKRIFNFLNILEEEEEFKKIKKFNFDYAEISGKEIT